MTSTTKVDAAVVAAPFRALVRQTIKERFGGHGPLLVGFLANDDSAAVQYAEWTRKACEADGIRYELRKVAREILEDKLEEANNDASVHGLILYYPIFGNVPSFYGGTMDDYLRDSIVKEKDVEGLCHTYRYNLYHNIRFLDTSTKLLKCILPCTPLAIVKVLEHLKIYVDGEAEGYRLRNKKIVIINRSDIVGRPLAAMLANDGADVFSVDINSIYLMRRGKLFETTETAQTACEQADVIVTGVPNQTYRLPVDWIRPNTTIINVSTFKNVDEEALLRIPSVTFVPLVGKVTVAMLERNLLRLYENFHQNQQQS